MTISGDRWGCLINADIVVTPKMKEAENQLDAAGAMCALSKRYEIPPSG
jgi:hypothetical protein